MENDDDAGQTAWAGPGQAAPAAPEYELSLKGRGVTVNRTIDEDIALEILAAVMRAARPSAPHRPHGGQPGARSPGGRGQSLREYMDEVGPKRNVEKILTVASYLGAARGQDTFGKDDVKREFRSASEPAPGNYPRDFNWAIQAGWIAPTDEPGQFFVTDTGRRAVEAKFPKEVRKGTGVQKTRRRRSRKAGNGA